MAEKATQQPQSSSALKRQTPAVDRDDPLSLQRDTAHILRHFSEHTSPSDVLKLQRTLGNRGVINMLQRAGLKKSSTTHEPAQPGSQAISRMGRGIVQRAVDEEGVPTDLNPATDASTIAGLKQQYVGFQNNLIRFWDSYGLEHPKNKQELFQEIWGHYLAGLKAGSKSQAGLATVKQVNDDPERTSKIVSLDYKSVLGVKSVPHPAAKPRTAEEEALADEMGVMRLQMANEAIVALKDLVEAFSAQFDKAISKVQKDSKGPWYKPWVKQKIPNYIFWSGDKAKMFVKGHHSQQDTIQLEMTMGEMAWLNGLDYNRNTKAPNAITAYTGQNFQIWTALSQRYALKAAAEQKKGHKWNFIGYMSDTPVDEQSVYNTIERPTIVEKLKGDLDITWKLIDEDDITKKLYIALESTDRQKVIDELKYREAQRKKKKP